MIQVRFIAYRFRKTFDAIVVFIMTYDIFDLSIIFVNHMRSNQLIQSTFFIEDFIFKFERYHNLNDLIHVDFRDLVSKVINN